MSNKVDAYIENHWAECIKHNQHDDGTLIGMPYPYTVPAAGYFNEMYYWDTYFTNEGLMCCGREQLAKNNVDNMLYLVNKYGYMPNGNRTWFLYNSQPPFLSEMVKRIYDFYNDNAWLNGAYDCIKKEYDFWMSKRVSPMGLNCYGGTWKEGDKCLLREHFIKRAGFEPDGDIEDIVRHYKICCESGWDCNPRWGMEGFNYAQVDLNSLLYLLEKNMEYFANELNKNEAVYWHHNAEKRQRLMLRYMTDKSGLLLDYNFKENCLSKVFSAASFMPLFAKAATTQLAEALVNNLHRLEGDYGIYTCEKNQSDGVYQWDYPNGWACMQYIAFKALDNYGYKEEAKRIAGKYIHLVEKVFSETGNLWEKYNVKEGSTDVKSENKMPAMMGWSAGVYLCAKAYIKNLL